MNLPAAPGAWSIVAVGLLLFLAEIVAYAAGYRLGARHVRDTTFQPEGISVVVGGLLGLLAFVLALTLSFAAARFDERRAGSLTEANAIGTAWLRAEAIGTQRAAETARLLVWPCAPRFRRGPR